MASPCARRGRSRKPVQVRKLLLQLASSSLYRLCISLSYQFFLSLSVVRSKIVLRFPTSDARWRKAECRMKPAFDQVVFQSVSCSGVQAEGGYSQLYENLCTLMDKLCKLFLEELSPGRCV